MTAANCEQPTFLWLADDGDKATVVFLGEQFYREICYVRGHYLPADDLLIAQGHRPSRRIVHHVALLESREVRLFEQGVTFDKDLARASGRYPLRRWAFQLQRHGVPKDKRTRYSITPVRELSAGEQEQLAALALYDLQRIYGPPPKRPTAVVLPAPRITEADWAAFRQRSRCAIDD